MREFCTTGDLRLSFTARASGCGGRRPARTCHGTVRQHVMTAERYAGLVWCGTACMVQKGCRILCSWQGECERSPLSTSAIDHTSARPGCSYKIPDALRRPARRLGSDEAGQDCPTSEQSANLNSSKSCSSYNRVTCWSSSILSFLPTTRHSFFLKSAAN